jgi:hypothetical protein
MRLLVTQGVVGFIIYKDRGIILHTSFEVSDLNRAATKKPGKSSYDTV